jgi:hypothetical protein
MQLPMVGNWLVLVHSVRPFTIHSDLYFDLTVERLDEPGSATFNLRVPQHAVAAEPTAGQRFSVTFLMGQVTAMTESNDSR